ncbi:unnamed protein product [Peronospora belbahrii]|uniref:Uncharacterized protein n=1 Tax=Peronospora belbahrii TaxID=622444 RepID=A0ABN8D7S1_9STRA|nr:unnamed protein product [Peronospora belbahrii]
MTLDGFGVPPVLPGLFINSRGCTLNEPPCLLGGMALGDIGATSVLGDDASTPAFLAVVNMLLTFCTR